MPVYFKRGNDTGEETSQSIEPISNGEPLNQTVLRRPVEHLRVRTDELRRVVTELEVNTQFTRELTVRTVQNSVTRQTYRGATWDAAFEVPARADRPTLVDGALSISAGILFGSDIPGAAIYGDNAGAATADQRANPFGYPYVLAYSLDFLPSTSLLISSPALHGGKIVISATAFSNYLNNYTDDSGVLLGFTDTVQGGMTSPGDSLCLILNRSKTPPAHAEAAHDAQSLVNTYSIEELTLGAEKTYPGIVSPALLLDSGAFIRKLPEKTFLKLAPLTGGDSTAPLTYNGVVYTDLHAYLRAAGAGGAFPGGAHIVEEDGSVSAGFKLCVSIRESWLDWGSYGGRGGPGHLANNDNAGDGSHNFDYLHVVRVHSDESLKRHTGTPAGNRGGIEVDYRQAFMLLHPDTPHNEGGAVPEGLRWALHYVEESNGTYDLAAAVRVTSDPPGAYNPNQPQNSGNKKAFILPRAAFPDELVLPLVSFDGAGFQFVGNGGYVPLPGVKYTIDINPNSDKYNEFIGMSPYAGGHANDLPNGHAYKGNNLTGDTTGTVAVDADLRNGFPYRSIGGYDAASLKDLVLPYRVPSRSTSQSLVLDRTGDESSWEARAYAGFDYAIGRPSHGFCEIRKVTVDLEQAFTPVFAQDQVFIRVNARFPNIEASTDARVGAAVPGADAADPGSYERAGFVLPPIPAGPNSLPGSYTYVPSSRTPHRMRYEDDGEGNAASGPSGVAAPQTWKIVSNKDSWDRVATFQVPVLEVYTVNSQGVTTRYARGTTPGTGKATVTIEYSFGK